MCQLLLIHLSVLCPESTLDTQSHTSCNDILWHELETFPICISNQSDSPDCECGTAIQTIEHIILNCPNTNNQREAIHSQIDYYTPALERNLDLNTLLWPSHSSPLLVIARAVTDALIVYLNNTNFTI